MLTIPNIPRSLAFGAAPTEKPALEGWSFALTALVLVGAAVWIARDMDRNPPSAGVELYTTSRRR